MKISFISLLALLSLSQAVELSVDDKVMCILEYNLHKNYTAFDHCPDVLDESAGALKASFFRCSPPPQRRCIHRIPDNFVPPVDQVSYRHHPPTTNVRLNTQDAMYPDFSALAARKAGDCVTCWRFEEERVRWSNFLDFIERVSGFKFANGPIRTVIDFGCGVGGFLAAVADRGVLGIGFARNWRKLPFLETAAARGVLAMHMDFRNHVPMVTGAVDMVHCSWLMNILSKQDEIEAILMEWDRLVRPGGYIVQYGFRNSDPNKFTELLGEIKRVARLLGWKELHWEQQRGDE